MKTKIVLVAALLAAGVALALVAVRGPGRPESLQDQVRAVASTLRCPVCQDLSVADSPSGLARQMRTSIGRDLRAGMSPGQIRSKFVAAYGQWILLSPPRRGLNLVAWIAPLLLLGIGLVVGGRAVTRWSASRAHVARGALVPALGTPTGPDELLSSADRRILERALRTVGDEEE